MRQTKSRMIKLASAAAAMLLCTVQLPTGVVAQETPQKEEVVYINLASDGAVETIHVVNIFDTENSSLIVDYGEYDTVRNMTTTDPITYKNGTVTVETDSDKLYYEGALKDTQIPWNIDIAYTLDGKAYRAEEIAGKSGKLEIMIDITENTAFEGTFFDGFALQASLALDTNRCRDIVAGGATVANVGSDKQLTYTILPGKGAHIQVSATVEDFEMAGIAINGIPLSLDIDVDTDALIGQVTTLLDAIGRLDSGAGSLEQGAGALQSGVQNELQSGAGELQSGANALTTGIAALDDGIRQIEEALEKLHAQSSALTDGSSKMTDALTQLQAALSDVDMSADRLTELTDASSAFMDGIDQIAAGVTELEQNVSYKAYKELLLENGLDVDFLRQSNETAMQELRTSIDDFKRFSALLEMAGYDAEALFNNFENIILLLEANNAYIDGTDTYLTTLNGHIDTLLEGVNTLQTNYAVFNDEIAGLVELLSGLTYNLSKLTDAIDTLVAEYAKLDDGIHAYTDGVEQIVEGYGKVSDGSAQLLKSSGAFASGTQALYSGTEELIAGVMELYKGAGLLKDGTSQMKAQTDGIDEKISTQVDELLASITGSNVAMASFVSEKNTDVEGVQFVIKTPAVEKAAEVVDASGEEQPQTFWQKLLALFGL